MRKNIMLATAIVVVGLMITSAASSISIQQTDQKENEIVAHYLSVQSQPIAKRLIDKSSKPLTFAGVAITGGDFDEFHPSVAGAPGGEFYAMAEYTEDDVVWHPMMYGSADGITWDPLVEYLYDNSEYTDMDQNAYGTYGTFGAPPDANGQIVVLQGEIMDGWVWDFGSYGIDEFSHNTIDCITFEGPEGDPGEWNWGGLTMSGHNSYVSPEIDGCPYVFYQYSAAGGGIIGWLSGDVAGCENVGSAMDLVTNMHYAVYDRDTGAGNYDLLVRKDNFGVWQYNSAGDYWTHPMVTNLKITDAANLMHPSVAANNNNVVIACQKDADVIVYYSLNGFSSKTEVTVETGAAYPEVAIAADGAVIVTYVKEGTMYMKTSDDGGASWGSAEVVSDNQINSNDQSANLDTYQGNVIGVWEDIRGDNVDIYFDMIYAVPNDPPLQPSITGPNGGKKGQAYTFNFNSVDPNGDQVKYFIDWGDTNTESTALVTEGTNHPVQHTYAEDGTYTITAYAQDALGLNGDPSIKEFKVARSKSIDLSIFSFLENHPNLFPILRQLLGL
ncbi:hypothetical protein AYK24_04075 [Thermoplasmatales archaeon SG8-52-4]|nr:MAG: hypothetical protein AYK24_04075 [Thermoplasmatales archaeon SG8-52-4]